MPTRLLISTVVLLWLRLGPGHDVARAQEHPQTAHESSHPAELAGALARLERALEHDAAEARRSRRVRGLSAAALGAVLVPVGVVLLREEDPVQSALGVGLVVGGASQIANARATFFPTAVERLHRDHEQRKTRAGSAQGELLRETEQIWRARAEDEHAGRRVVGIAYAALGAALMPVGLAFLLSERQLFEASEHRQYKLGSALLGMGVPFVGIGLQLVFEPAPLERSYAAYTSDRPERQGAVLSGALLPMRGGAVASLAAQY